VNWNAGDVRYAVRMVSWDAFPLRDRGCVDPEMGGQLRETDLLEGPSQRCVIIWHDRRICRISAYGQEQKVCIVKPAPIQDNGLMTSLAHKIAVGRRLRIAIEAKGLTQAQVCRELNESTTKLGNWLRGDNYPEPWFVARFCTRYGITTDWIYRGIVSGASEDVAGALWKAARETPEA